MSFTFSEKQRNIMIIAGIAIIVAAIILVTILIYSNKLKAVTAEKDKMKVEKETLQEENNTLTQKNNSLSTDYNSLNQKYQTLMDSVLSKNAQLGQVVQNKTDELKKKEKKLRAFKLHLNKQDSISRNISKLLKVALGGYKTDELKIENKMGKVYITVYDKVLFKTGSSTIESKGNEILKKISAIVGKYPSIDIAVESHTDNTPLKIRNYKDNLELTASRATNIVRIFNSDLKINSNRLTAIGKGEFDPAADNKTADGKLKNKRTEIILSLKMDDLYKIIQTTQK